ncbi:MAG: hypothetical protein IJ391_06980 [Clostridia bacterium]|nr:hypothetical protein [Clostridia bacterium]
MKKITAIALCMVMLLTLLSGCGSKRSEGAEKYLSEQLDVFKDANEENIESILGGDGSGAIFSGMDPAFFLMLYENLDYTIVDSSENGDTAEVKVKISNIDCGAVMQDYITKLMLASAESDYEDTSDANDWEAYDDELSRIASEVVKDIAENGEYETIENTVTVSLTKVDGEWTIDNTEEFSAALLPGLGDLVDSETY